jgi:tetratricopeptide (TPR) repeat protein
MWPRLKNSQLGILTFFLMVQVMLLAVPSQAKLRKIKVGEKMPEFSLADPNGNVFAYSYNRKRVLAITFLSANQKQSESAVVDIEKILIDLHSKTEPFDFVGVISERAKKDFFESYKGDSKLTFPILIDTKYQLWGKLGIIAMPTVLIVGKDDKVLWLKAGYGYDFSPALRSHLSYALGIVKAETLEKLTQVKTLANTTVTARVKRHLQMAKMLDQKGRLESAIAEAHKAKELDPNSLEVALELGELFCRVGKNKAALNIVERIKATKRLDKARLLRISGWAKRQMGDLETAEKNLLEATKLDPKSCRGFFELGQVYQVKRDKDKAIAAYYRALTLVFGGR